MHLRFLRPRRLAPILAIIGLSAPLPALADSVPESIRIQEKAEKSYESAPVVPIERQNAHHRDSPKDAPASENRKIQPVVPSAPRQDSDR